MLSNLNKPASNSDLLTLSLNHISSASKVNNNFAYIGNTKIIQKIMKIYVSVNLFFTSDPVSSSGRLNSMILFENDSGMQELILS